MRNPVKPANRREKTGGLRLRADRQRVGCGINPCSGVAWRADLGVVDCPPPCGEGLGVGGIPTANVLPSPLPVPPPRGPTRGEGTRIALAPYGWLARLVLPWRLTARARSARSRPASCRRPRAVAAGKAMRMANRAPVACHPAGRTGALDTRRIFGHRRARLLG